MTIIFSHSTSPAFNLAAEEYLFTQREDDLLFLYVNEPCVVIGSNQVLRNEVNTAFCEANNIHVVRRLSGGGAVYHDAGNLNYCFISKRREEQSPLNGAFLRPVVEMLHTLGIPVETGKRKDLWIAGGHKISGTASHVTQTRELHHGTLLYDANLFKLHQSLSVASKDSTLKGTASVPSPVRNIRDFIFAHSGEALDSERFFDACLHAFSSCYETPVSHLSPKEIDAIMASYYPKYSQVEWTWRK